MYDIYIIDIHIIYIYIHVCPSGYLVIYTHFDVGHLVLYQIYHRKYTIILPSLGDVVW